MKPRASTAAMRSIFKRAQSSEKASVITRNVSGSWNSVVMSRKLMPGFGQSRTVRTRALRNSASSAGVMRQNRDEEPTRTAPQEKRAAETARKNFNAGDQNFRFTSSHDSQVDC